MSVQDLGFAFNEQNMKKGIRMWLLRQLNIQSSHMIQKFPLLGIYLSIYPKESQGNFLDDRNVPYLDDGGDYMGVYICQNWVNGTGR